MTHQTSIPFLQFRGGSSKGVYLHRHDLPSDPAIRDDVLKWIMGAHGDPRQIDGLGGADPLTSKIAIIGPSSHPDCDIDYHFMQAIIGEDRLDDTPNCGNILSAVGAFALETGVLDCKADTASISIFMTNSGNQCRLEFPVLDGLPLYHGTAQIDGVAGTAAPVMCVYQDLAGSACGSLLPTGSARDMFDGISVTCIDNGMPVICLNASDFGLEGTETPDELNANTALKERLERIRLVAGPAMGLGDVSTKAVPKMCLISAARFGGSFSTRSFIPKTCHKAIGVLGAVSAATAVCLEGSAVHDSAALPASDEKSMRIEHPSGVFDVQLNFKQGAIMSAGLLRTTRLLARGEVFVPTSVWAGPIRSDKDNG